MNKKLLLNLLILLIASNCSGGVYSIEKCYEKVDDYAEESSDVATYISSNNLRSRSYYNGFFDHDIVNVLFLEEKYILSVSEGPYPTNNEQLRRDYISYLESVKDNVLKIYTALDRGEQGLLYRLIDEDYANKKSNYIIQYKNDPHLYALKINDPYFSIANYDERDTYYKFIIDKEKELNLEVLLLDDLLDENGDYENLNIVFGNFFNHDHEEHKYDEGKYLKYLERHQSLVSEYSYFFTEHPECAEINEFSNFQNRLELIYSWTNDEIEYLNLSNKLKNPGEETIYPSGNLSGDKSIHVPHS